MILRFTINSDGLQKRTTVRYVVRSQQNTMESFVKYIFYAVALMAVVDAGAIDLDPSAIQKLKETAEKCQKQTGATPEDLQALMGQKIPGTKTGLCFAACAKKELGFMNADNTMNMDKVKAVMEKHITDDNLRAKALEVATKCNAEVKIGSDECAVAKDMMECVLKYQKEMGISAMSFLGDK